MTDEDPIRNRLNAIFENRVGEKPESQVILDKIYEEGESRYAHGIPPGFCEPNKKGKSLDDNSSIQLRLASQTGWVVPGGVYNDS